MRCIDEAPNSLKTIMKHLKSTEWALGIQDYAYRIYLSRKGYPGGQKVGNVRQSLIDILEDEVPAGGTSLQDTVMDGVDFDKPPRGGGRQTPRRGSGRRR